jgi:drug/metabolite transporter (DMT)-like permease
VDANLSASLAGPAACLSAAFLWAVSVGLFRAPIQRYGARSINLVKCLVAAVLQGLTVWAVGQGGTLLDASGRSLVLIIASGLVGLTLGDTALFGAVVRIGVHRTLLLQTLAPVFTALIAFAWQGERLSRGQMAGAALVLAGIAVVVAPPGSPRRWTLRPPAPPANVPGGRALLIAGLLLGVLAALGQGAGVALAKAGMSDLPVMAASFLRLGAAALGLVLLSGLAGRLRALPRLVGDRSSTIRVIPATLMGTYLALFLMMAGVALAPASIAAVLLSTSPVFSLFLEALIDKKPITARGLLGTLLAVAGVGVLTAL